MKRPTSEEVKVEMGNGFAAVGPIVDDDAESGFFYPDLGSHLSAGPEQGS
jgi:hypothetical protein